MIKAKTCIAIGLCAAAAVLPALPAYANSAAIEYFRGRADRTAVPKLLTQDERNYYKDLFAAINKADWTRVQAMLAQKPDGPLHLVAKAEYYLAAKSPKVDTASLDQWLAQGKTLPEAEQIAALATRRGSAAVPALPYAQPLTSIPSMPKRIRPRETGDGTMPGGIAAGIQARIKADNPTGARVMLDGITSMLSPAARSEWRSKVAWSFYIENDDANALTVAQSAGDGAGPWMAEGLWIAGLASWRQGQFANAADFFARTAASAENGELKSAAWYWQSRAHVRAGEPQKSAPLLRQAAARDETFYGMMAADQLGLKIPESHAAPDFTQADWQQLRDLPNVRAAVALAEIGEDGMADEVLRHQARIGGAAQYPPLSRLARDLGMPSTQLWMGSNAPAGGKPEPALRFPTPKWTPVTGWKVDPALIYAHTLQESVFRTKVVSPAGAKGLMQIMPAAAKDRSVQLQMPGGSADLTRPEVNFAFGQAHLQIMRGLPGTQGLLPKVMASYNAGPAPIARWNTEIKDQGDPLLWIESIPYWETRGYVNIVMRNYWMYERQAGGPSESRMALVQGMWPTFPDLNGSEGVRMASNGTLLRGR